MVSEPIRKSSCEEQLVVRMFHITIMVVGTFHKKCEEEQMVVGTCHKSRSGEHLML